MHVALSEFLNDLFNEGRVQLSRPTEISHAELQEADKVIVAFEQNYRRELPAIPPLLCLPASRWAATVFYRACQFAVFRDVGQEIISQTMAVPCPEGDPPAIHYSVDLTFRFLPDLFKLAKSASLDDPLLMQLMRLAVRWPLSSVGISGIDKIETYSWEKHPALLTLYVDRVIARSDVSRLSNPTVREAIQRALGVFPDLAPKMAVACNAVGTLQEYGMENVL